jgi:ElaB/YqjD/DUF883 family membrane-anchored ribosome-binding protein
MDRTTQKILDDLRSLVTGLEALVAETADRAGERLEDTAGSVREQLEQARERLSDLEQDVRGGVRRAAKAAGESIGANPWMSLAVVAAVAFLCGVALSRRSRTDATDARDDEGASAG